MDVKERVKKLKYSTACCICRYYKNDKCENKKSCFWKDLEQALTELEKIKVFNESLQKDIDRLNKQCIDLHLKDSKQSQILEVLKKCFWELDLINEAQDYKQYSGWFEVRCGTPTLNETEFNLIKEWLWEKQ